MFFEIQYIDVFTYSLYTEYIIGYTKCIFMYVLITDCLLIVLSVFFPTKIVKVGTYNIEMFLS